MGVELTIIGLGQIGASIGLALADKSLEINRTGHDADPDAAARAQKIGAVDRIQRNIHAAVEKADLVILAVAADLLRETLELIRQDLQPNTVVMDTSALRAQATAWAEELLPAGQTFVSFTPMISAAHLEETATGIEAARADLFKDAVVLINTPAASNPDAIRVASELAGILGCKPLFADLLEAEGLLAASHLLPFLVSAALVNAATRQPGWREARKLAGRAFLQISKPLLEMDGATMFGQSAILNRENAVRVLNNVVSEILTIRDLIEKGDSKELHKLLHNAERERQVWWKQRTAADWEERPSSAGIPTPGETLARFFGFRRRKSE
ncbi:MAG: prephenate dehydrogenase [Anaerolineae bacterium]|nr:prephenate dehydrogenase [Anaerolineae bacterium]